MILALLLALSIPASPLLAQRIAPDSVSFQRVAFAADTQAVVHGRRFVLSGPDVPGAATAWEGPLRISKAQHECTARVSLVSAVWSSESAQYAIVISNSGSSTFVHYVDLATCREHWPALKVQSDSVIIAANRVQVLPNCTCPSPDAPCRCSAGLVYRLSNNRRPVLQPSESRALTVSRLGVAFVGRRSVRRPGTSTAKLLK